MRPIILLLAWLAMTASAMAQINVPAEIDQYKMVPAQLTVTIPEGAATVDGGWTIVPDRSGVAVDMFDMGREIRFVAPPGKYKIMYDANLTKEVRFKDGDGNEIVLNNYLGRIKGEAFCVIKGETPPNPPPPPVPTSEIAVKVRELLGQVQGETRASEAAKLADWFAAAAKEIATANDPLSQTKLVTPEAALAALDANATSILGDRRASWATFFNGLKTFMERIINVEKKLPNTVFGVGQAFEEIATGLRAQAVTPSHASVAAPTSIEGHAVQTPTAGDPSSTKSSSSSHKSTGSSRRGLFGRIR